MSLYHNLLDEASDLSIGYSKQIKVWDWVRSKIDFPKFRARAALSRTPPNKFVKVVLMEYSASYRNGDSTTHFYVPGGGPNTRCLQYDTEVLDYLRYQIANRDPTVVIYSRRKIVDDKPHPFLRQLVVKFNVPPPIPEDLPSYVEPLDSDTESS
jgi:hypothetical protein